MRHKHYAKPPRYKTFMLTWLAIYPMINLILILFGAWLDPLPLYLRTLCLTIVLVFLMTYVVMPWLTTAFIAGCTPDLLLNQLIERSQ